MLAGCFSGKGNDEIACLGVQGPRKLSKKVTPYNESVSASPLSGSALESRRPYFLRPRFGIQVHCYHFFDCRKFHSKSSKGFMLC